MAKQKPDRKGGIPAWVEQRLLPDGTARGIRRAVLQDLMDLSDSRLAVFHDVAFRDGEMYVTDLEVVGPPEAVEFMQQFDGRAIRDISDPTPSAMAAANRFTEDTKPHSEDNKLYRVLWAPLGLVSVLQVTGFSGGATTGWIGAYRSDGEPLFGSKTVSRAQKRVDAYLHCLEIAAGLARGESRDGIALLEPSGRVAYACPVGTALFQDHDFRSRVARLLPRCLANGAETFSAGGKMVRLSKVSGKDGELLCAQIHGSEPWQGGQVVGLSLQRRRVAELVAAGATIPEAARSLELQPETVRGYLKQVYLELGVSSRLELRETIESAGMQVESE